MRHILLSVHFVLLAACSGEPFAAERELPDAGSADPAPAPPDEHALVPPPRMRPALGFARHASGGIAVFDRQSGKTLAQKDMAGPVLDIVWHASFERAFVVRGEPGLDACAVEALAFDGQALASVAQSEPLGGTARLHAWGDRVLAFAEEMGTSWWVYDADLKPLAPPKALFRPAAVVTAGDGELLALDASRFESDGDADAIVKLGLDGQWALDLWSFPAPGRPNSRFADATEPDSIRYVRKLATDGRFELAEIDALSPAVPSSFAQIASEAIGSLEDAVVDAERELLVTTLSGDVTGGGGKLVVLPLAAGASSTIDLGASIESSPWPSRQLARDPVSGRWLVATGAGVRAFAVAGGKLAEASGFEGSALRAPLVLADP